MITTVVAFIYTYSFSVGSAINADNKLGRYAGNALPDPLFPETNQMLLNFVTDQLVSGKGFDVSYCSNPDGCGGDLSGTHGNMYLSGYPQVIWLGIKTTSHDCPNETI